MKKIIATGFRRAFSIAVPLCFSVLAAVAQSDPRQTVCQMSWQNCLATAEGKNWKPVYDRCLKARSACLGGRAFTPEIPVVSPSTAVRSIAIQQGEGSGNDQANADPATRAASCENGKPRGDNNSCVLVPATQGYGQNFSLLGPGVPMSRIQRASSVVKCAGGKIAMFYPNGRIESCTLDNYGAMGTPLSDTSGKVVICEVHAVARFDPEGRLLSCPQF
jgi:hypothetical protein